MAFDFKSCGQGHLLWLVWTTWIVKPKERGSSPMATVGVDYEVPRFYSWYTLNQLVEIICDNSLENKVIPVILYGM